LPNTLNWMIGVIIITALIHFFLYSLLAYTIESNKEKSFVQQYNKVMEKYEKTNDPYMLHDELSAIRFLPVKQETKNAFNLSRSEEHTSELQSRFDLVCRLLLEKKK